MILTKILQKNTRNTEGKNLKNESKILLKEKKILQKNETTFTLDLNGKFNKVPVHFKNPTDDRKNLHTKSADLLKLIYLPNGYPESVNKYYWPYYKWYNLQNIVSSAMYVISTTALLTSVGVTSTAAPAAAISWILKDGFGSAGVIFFASYYSSSFDSDLKRNRIKADFFHCFGIGIELITPLVPQFFVPMASLANIFKGVAGVTTGATRAALNKTFSVSENMGDVTAKYQAQGITCYLIGLGFGISVTSVLGTAVQIMLPLYASLTGLYLVSSYYSLQNAKLDTLNRERFSLIIDHWAETKEILTPELVSSQECLLKKPKYQQNKFQIELGCTVDQINNTTSQNSKFHSSFENLFKVFENEKYFISNSDKKIYIALSPNATNLDIIKSYFHGYYGIEKMKYSADESLQKINETFPDFLKKIKNKNWKTEKHLLAPNSTTISFSTE